jgi:NitT/TauT family transport system substrate-binding protein
VKARLRLMVIAVLLAALTLGIASAGQGAREQRVSIRYSTSFGNFGREAYAYVALEKGYFRDAGFDVTIVPGTGTVPVMRLIAAGQVDYGPGDTSAAVLARANDGLLVKAVALIQQNTMSAILSLRETGITRPRDLEGKKVADSPGSTVTILLPYYARKAGFDASKVTIVPASPPAIPTLVASKQVDAGAQFTVGIPLFQAAAGGKPIASLPYARHIPGLMGNGLYTTDERIRTRPGEVRRFTAALLRGLRYAISNPGDAGRILNKHVPLADPVVAAKELRIMKKYVETPASRKNGYGYVDPKRFAATVSIVNNFFKPRNRVTVADVYARGFVPRQTRK